MADVRGNIPFDKLQLKLRWAFVRHRMDRWGPFRLPYTVFWFMLEGFRTIEIRGKQLSIQKGDLLIVPPQTKFSIYSGEQEEKCTHLSWVGDVRIGDVHLVEYYEFPLLTSLAHKESALLEQVWRKAVDGSEIFNNIQSDQKSTFESIPEYIFMQSSQLEWLAQLCQLVRSQIPLKSVSLDSRIEDTCNFIQMNMAEKLTVKTLAGRLYMSESHFRSLFKINTGIAPALYIRKSRIGMARNLILSGDCSLTEISLLAGFASQSEFCRAFQLEEGMSPLQYRKKFVQI